MKRIIALALVMLMAIPFGMLGASADAQIPAEPTATGTAVVYTAYTTNEDGSKTAATANDGSSLDKMYSTKAFSSWRALFRENAEDSALGAAGKLMDGGYFVIVGKALAALGTNWNYEGVVPVTTKPIVITGKDPANGTSYVSTKDGDIYYMTETYGNAGQYGMFMMDSGTTTESNTLVFEGEVIFQDTVILNRTNKKLADEGRLAPTISAKGKLVIDSTVKFASMEGQQKYILNVDEGAYAYLHALGFGKYTGKGTIVVGEEIEGQVTQDTFAGFEGTVVYESSIQGGNTETPDNPGQTPDTGDMTWVAAAVAMIAVAGSAILLKKREN